MSVAGNGRSAIVAVRKRPLWSGRPFVRALVPLTVVAVAIHLVDTSLGWGTAGFGRFVSDWDYDIVILCAGAICLLRGLLVAEDAPVWLLLGAALLAWAGGDVYENVVFGDAASVPTPSVADAFYLVFYPLVYLSLILLIRSRVRRISASYWLEGAVQGLAVAAFAATFIDRAVVSRGLATSATNLAYPLGDLVLLSLVVTAFALSGWKPDASLTLLGLGLAIAAAADTWYFYAQATGSYADGRPLDSLWPVAAVLLSLAAWQPGARRPMRGLEGWPVLVMPLACSLGALGLLVLDHFSPVNLVALALATATLLVALTRLTMSFGEHLGLLGQSRRQALQDALTGLGNRRKLLVELGAEIEANPPSPLLLVFFDLDGFKRYNDTYGHPAGDALLAWLGRRLASTLGRVGRGYRLGGDEFCVLLPGGDGTEPVAAMAAPALDALSERGDGFSLSSSYGTVSLPEETDDLREALQLADQRMYANKARAPRSADSRAPYPFDWLLDENPADPLLDDGQGTVAELAAGVAGRLGSADPDIGVVTRAAELRDIGKLAVPRTILDKPGPLDGTERGYVQLHPAIGERVLAQEPSLRQAAKLVRSTHERYDGRGYPDGLVGEAIPLGARVIRVCDSFSAMVTPRPYRAPTSAEDAIAVLRGESGSRFDPVVVEAFEAELGVRPTAERHTPAAGLS